MHEEGPTEDPIQRHPSAIRRGAVTYGRHRRWVLVGLVLASIGLLASLFGFGLSRDPDVVQSVLVGRPAPDFSLEALDANGPSIRLSDFRGQVVVLNFWASWCADCRVEHPNLLAAWQRYRDQGVVFLGIPFEDAASASRAFQTELGGGWPLLRDPGSRTAITYGVYGVPETFIVRPDGVIAYKQIGPIPYTALTEEITRMLVGRSS